MNLERAARIFAFLSAALILVSISASQVALGLAIATILAARLPLRIPPVRLPLALFVAGTLLALAVSPEPRAGLPQVVKFFVLLTLVTVTTTFRDAEDCRKLILSWTVLATASAVLSFFQFWRNHSDYGRYVVARPTGFMSHWMTFGGEGMIVLTLLCALLLFAPLTGRRWLVAGWGVAAVLAFALLLNGSRNAWAGAAGALGWLLWRKRPILVAIVPVAALVLYFSAPPVIRERAASITRPHGETDSNSHRKVLFRTGVRIIAAHPWFGVGPERIGKTFMDYLPPGTRLPLPDGFYGHLHNVYLQIAAERGLPVLGVLLWFLARILVDFGRALKPARERSLDTAILSGATAAVAAVLIAGLAEHNLGDSEVLTMFLATVSMGYLQVEGRIG